MKNIKTLTPNEKQRQMVEWLELLLSYAKAMTANEQQVRARFGSPFESDGTCEGCDRQHAAVWLAPDGAPGFNDLLFCADCILKGEVE